MNLIIPFSVIVGLTSYWLTFNIFNSEQAIISGIAGGLFTLLLLFSFNEIFRKITQKSALGIAIGTVVATLLYFSLSTVIDNLLVTATYVPYVKTLTLLVLTFIGITVGLAKTSESSGSFRKANKYKNKIAKILDTSVIIDGRIADVAEVGFIEGDIIIPKFVIKELQYIADSSDPVKRVRGRRGLDIIKRMQKDIPEVAVKITNHDFNKIREVDLKLVELAKKIKGVVITNDFNLNKVAGLQGVKVLNLNQLANAIKPIVLPGEVMNLMLVKAGKEQRQAIGYLDDGTMIVVDDAINYIGKEIDVSITSVLQTSTGRMIFAKINRENMISRING